MPHQSDNGGERRVGGEREHGCIDDYIDKPLRFASFIQGDAQCRHVLFLFLFLFLFLSVSLSGREREEKREVNMYLILYAAWTKSESEVHRVEFSVSHPSR